MSTSTKTRLPILILAGVVAALVGVFFGTFLAKSSLEKVAVDPVQTARRTPLSGLVPTQKSDIPDANLKVKPLRETLGFEGQLARMDLAEFPSLLQNELRNATESDKAFKIAARWVERDPDGFVMWLRQRRGKFSLQESGHQLGLTGSLLSHLAKEDPARAWEAAKLIPGNTSSLQSDVLSLLLRQNPDEAVKLVRADRLALSHTEASYGRWSGLDPELAVPVLNELLRGPGRESMIWDALYHYSEADRHPDRISESTAWYTKLTPELKRHARDQMARKLSRTSPEIAPKILKAWDDAEAAQP